VFLSKLSTTFSNKKLHYRRETRVMCYVTWNLSPTVVRITQKIACRPKGHFQQDMTGHMTLTMPHLWVVYHPKATTW